MNEVKQLRVQEKQPNEHVVRCLRRWLRRAKAGEIHGIMIQGVAPAGNHIRSKAGDMGFANGIFLLALQKQEILAEAAAVSIAYERSLDDAETDDECDDGDGEDIE